MGIRVVMVRIVPCMEVFMGFWKLKVFAERDKLHAKLISTLASN
jgi:hypothetical protein